MKVHDSSGNTVTTNIGRHQLTKEAPPIGGFMYYITLVGAIYSVGDNRTFPLLLPGVGRR